MAAGVIDRPGIQLAAEPAMRLAQRMSCGMIPCFGQSTVSDDPSGRSISSASYFPPRLVNVSRTVSTQLHPGRRVIARFLLRPRPFIDAGAAQHAAELNIKPITGAVLAGLMGTWSDTVNMVNAPFLAKDRGIGVREIRNEGEGDYHTLLAVTVGTEDQGARRVEGTIFGNRAARLVNIFGVPIEAELTGQMIYIVNDDQPGFIGALGTQLGENRINIATFNLGRRKDEREAIALIAVDDPISAEVAQQLHELPGVREVVPLSF